MYMYSLKGRRRTIDVRANVDRSEPDTQSGAEMDTSEDTPTEE